MSFFCDFSTQEGSFRGERFFKKLTYNLLKLHIKILAFEKSILFVNLSYFKQVHLIF